jgi:hypothetical protein
MASQGFSSGLDVQGVENITFPTFVMGIPITNEIQISADPFFNHRNRMPYLNNYMLSFQRQLTGAALLAVSYVGNQGNYELALVSVNRGNPALYLNLASICYCQSLCSL